MQKRKCRRRKYPAKKRGVVVPKKRRVKIQPPPVDLDADPVPENLSAMVRKTVSEPLMGTPKEVQKELDALAIHMKKHPTDSDAFCKIHGYMLKYLMGLVYRRYPYICGSAEDDVHQEAMLSILFKAIPKFNPKKGMSFLNFAKMCVNRHLITMLHASKNRRKDMPINKAMSLDHSPSGEVDDENCSLSNIITDERHCEPPFKEMDQREAYELTLRTLKARLSEFEIVVLEEYLRDHSYKDAAKNIVKRIGHERDEKSVDNALLRIRKKAAELLAEEKDSDNLPLITIKKP